MPFTIKKKAGHEDRYAYEETLIDTFLSAQELRDVYFKLSGQSYKVGQTTCVKFPNISALIREIKRLILLYINEPAKWQEALNSQEKAIERRHRKNYIKDLVEKYDSAPDDEIDMLYRAILMIRNKRKITDTKMSDSE
jgi:hypothetical protein